MTKTAWVMFYPNGEPFLDATRKTQEEAMRACFGQRHRDSHPRDWWQHNLDRGWTCRMIDLDRSSSPAPSGAAMPVAWRHLKHGTTYTEVGRALLQASTGSVGEAATLVVYRDDSTGRLWARAEDEFEDGRFEKVVAPPAPSAPPAATPEVQYLEAPEWPGKHEADPTLRPRVGAMFKNAWTCTDPGRAMTDAEIRARWPELNGGASTPSATGASDGPATQDTAWFWEIVDRAGLADVPSDERGALALLCERAARVSAAPPQPPAPAADLAGAVVSVLREHHEWHLAQEQEDANAYAESELCDRTDAALHDYAGAEGVPAELRALSEAATPGPWFIFCEALMRGVMAPSRCVVGHVDKMNGDPWERDAAFIVAAVNYVRARLAGTSSTGGD